MWYDDNWRRQRGAYYDKLFVRKAAAPFDERWHALAPEARSAFLLNIKVSRKTTENLPAVPAARFPEGVVAELRAAGLVTVRVAGKRVQREEVVAAREALDFNARIHAVNRLRLLGDEPDLAKYVSECFEWYELGRELAKVVRANGRSRDDLAQDVVRLYVATSRWPGWVARYLKDPLAQPILDAIFKAGGQVPLATVPEHLPDTDPEAVRATLEKLIVHCALFEDLHPLTKDLMVGLLPSVRAGLERQTRPRTRRELQPCPTPAETAPEGGYIVPDLRTVLLELASVPARLRQDRALFQKELPRFLDALDPFPAWLAGDAPRTPESRLDEAVRLASQLRLVKESFKDEHDSLRLGKRGQKWLGSPAAEQYASVYEWFRGAPEEEDTYYWDEYSFSDSLFLGSHITAKKATKHRAYPTRREAGESLQPLRSALYRAFEALPPGVFHRLADFVEHAVFGEHNPVLLGLKPEEVDVRQDGRRVPEFEEHLEAAGRRLLVQFLANRLVPLGCVQLGRDPGGAVLIARRPRLNVYFDRPLPEGSNVAEETGRVVVQPDYSVIVIGGTSAPAAELAPFCERVPGRSSAGSLTFRITRESVLRGIANGLTGEEILARLARHSSMPLPANVLHEVHDWGGWVRVVPTAPLTVFRCPDAATADRVVGALGKDAERLNETVVAVPRGTLDAVIRNKLRSQGVLMKREESSEALPVKKRKRRRSR
jgi:hypothetical protein